MPQADVSAVCSGVSESVLCSEMPQYPNTPIPQYPKDGDPKDGRTDGDREDMDAASVLDHMDL